MPIDIAGTILEGGRQRAGTLLKLADLAAQNRQQSGALWGSTLANIGQNVTQLFDPARRQAAELGKMKVDEARQQQADTKALDAAFRAGPSQDEVMAALLQDPNAGHLVPVVSKHFEAVNKAALDRKEAMGKVELADRNYLGALAAGVAVWNGDPQTQMYAFDAALQHALEAGHDPKQVQQIQAMIKADPSKLQPLIKSLIENSPEQTELLTKRQTAASSASNAASTAARLKAELPKIEADAATAQAVQSGMVGGLTPEQQVQKAARDAAAVETAQHNRAMESAARARISAGASSDQGEAKAIADAIVRGEQPPVLTGLYRFAAPVRAELAKQGYDQSAALSDWNATQRHISSLNSTQQLRLREAVDLSKHSLDLIDGLASEWKGGKFPLLNKANLVAAKNGVYGQQAASVATRLVAQIADLTSELGTVYKGGNGSTDESLKLAATNLAAEWDEKVLLDAIKMVRKNLTIRENSIKNVAPVTVSGGANEYAGRGAGGGPGVGVTVVGKDGVSYTFPSQSAADAFKKAGG